MHVAAPRYFRLSKTFGLDCTPDGVTLAGVALLRRTRRGFIPRDDLEIRWLLERAYGTAVDADHIAKGLAAVARALNQDESSRAMIRALLLDLPELDWTSAARLAHANDALAKFDPDEPRDDRGRWAANGNAVAPAPFPHGLPPRLSRPALRLVSAGPEAAHDDDAPPAAAPETEPEPEPDEESWVSLPPGERIDELGDLLEWVANAKPDEAPDIRSEIRRLYYAHGDTRGGDALNLALSDALEAANPAERTDILERFEPYTREDPDQAAADATALSLGATLIPRLLQIPAEVPAAIPPGAGTVRPVYAPEFWEDLSPVERGRLLHEARSPRLASNFPTIDDEVDGLITSTKSIDLRTRGYQNAVRLRSAVNRYVDKLAKFDGARWDGEDIASTTIRSRKLDLIVPRGSVTEIQNAVLTAAQKRAWERGVYLKITFF